MAVCLVILIKKCLFEFSFFVIIVNIIYVVYYVTARSCKPTATVKTAEATASDLDLIYELAELLFCIEKTRYK